MFLRPAVYAPNHVYQSQKYENKATFLPLIENYLNSVLASHTKSNYYPQSLKRNSKADAAKNAVLSYIHALRSLLGIRSRKQATA